MFSEFLLQSGMSLEQFLQWLVAGGGSIMAVSFVFERMAWFQALSPTQKDNAIFFASVVVGVGSLAFLNYVPQEVISAITPYFLVVASTFATVYIGKAFHRVDKPKDVSVTINDAENVTVTSPGEKGKSTTVTNIQNGG